MSRISPTERQLTLWHVNTLHMSFSMPTQVFSMQRHLGEGKKLGSALSLSIHWYVPITHTTLLEQTHTSRWVNRAASTTLCPNVGAAMLFSLFNTVLFMKQ